MGLSTSGSKPVLAERLSKQHDGRQSDLGAQGDAAASPPHPSAAAAAVAVPSRAGGRGHAQGKGRSTAAARPGDGPPRLKQTSKRDNFVRMNMKVRSSGCLLNALTPAELPLPHGMVHQQNSAHNHLLSEDVCSCPPSVPEGLFPAV